MCQEKGKNIRISATACGGQSQQGSKGQWGAVCGEPGRRAKLELRGRTCALPRSSEEKPLGVGSRCFVARPADPRLQIRPHPAAELRPGTSSGSSLRAKPLMGAGLQAGPPGSTCLRPPHPEGITLSSHLKPL